MPLIGDGGALIKGEDPIIGGPPIKGGPVGSKPKNGGLPTLISEGGGIATDGTTSTMDVPLGGTAQSGNLIMVSVYHGTDGIFFSVPAGFKNAGGTYVSGQGQIVTFWKIADGTEGTAITVTTGSNVRMVGHASLWKNHDSTWPLANSEMLYDPSDPTNLVIPAIDLTQKKCRAYYVAGLAGLSAGDSTFNQPSGYTEMYDDGDAGNTQMCTGYSNEAATVGANNLTITRTNPGLSQTAFAQHFIIRSKLKNTPADNDMRSHYFHLPGAATNLTQRFGWAMQVQSHDFKINQLGLYPPLGAASITQNIRIHRHSDEAVVAELNLNPGGLYDQWVWGSISETILEAGKEYTISFRYGGVGRAVYRDPTAIMLNTQINTTNRGVYNTSDARPTTNSSNNYMSSVAFRYVG